MTILHTRIVMMKEGAVYLAKSLAKRVKELRLEKGLNQVEMSVLMGISLSTLCRIEAGRELSRLVQAKVDKFLQAQTTQAA